MRQLGAILASLLIGAAAWASGDANKQPVPNRYPMISLPRSFTDWYLIDITGSNDQCPKTAGAATYPQGQRWVITAVNATSDLDLSDTPLGLCELFVGGANGSSYSVLYAGTATPVQGPGANFLLNAGATGVSYFFQVNGFGFYSNGGTVDTHDWFIGLANRDTLSPGLVDGATDYIGFRHRDVATDASNALYFVADNAGNGTTGNMFDANKFSTTTGWTVTNSGGANLLADFNNRVISSDRGSTLTFILKEQLTAGPGSTTIGLVWVYVDGIVVAGSPFTIANAGTKRVPDTNVGFAYFLKRTDAGGQTASIFWQHVTMGVQYQTDYMLGGE